MNTNVDNLLKNISLENRLKVLNEMAFINLLTELGYREDKMWSESENDNLRKICFLAEKLMKEQILEIKEWKVNGKP